ncbi:MAG TPA: sensor histidine kinase [Nocardioides sp.]|nr:sensor histidine kinase [Nocardioides sp.]
MARLALRRPRPVDVALTLACIVLMHVEIPLNAKADASLVGSVAIVVASLPVLLRSQTPVLAYVLSFITMYGVIATVSVYNTMPAPVVLCAYAVAERYGLRAALVTGIASLPVVLAILQVFSPHGILSWGTAQNLALIPLPLALGVAAHARRGYTTMLIERAEAAERSREAEASRRVDEERLRIARDVHDVVAHAMVTINVQAGVGAHLLDRDPAQAYDTLRSIKQVSGDALTDLRAMLGLLREEGGGADVGGAAPAPPVQRLADLGDLRESLAAAGLDVAFDVDPGARTLPAAVDATCFRVVQEALTNTLRHAGSTSAQVRVVRADGRVVLEVLDSGGTPSRPLRDSGSGHGLTGMRERVAALGGTLDAGPRASGGWRVAASIPLVQSDASPVGRDVGVPAS